METEEQETTEQPTILEQTQKAISELKEQNKILEANLLRGEKLKAEQLLGGGSMAGQTLPPVPKVDTPEEYAAKVDNGEIDPFNVVSK